MRAEIARLIEEDQSLDRDWRRIPYLLAFAVLAAPAYWIWGPLAAIGALLCTPCLLGTAAYLIGVRKREARDLRAELEGELDALLALEP